MIARASSNRYRATTQTPGDIARELDARYLLTATVRWQKSEGSSRIRVTPELVEISGTGAPATRWQQAFDAELADVFEVQGRIAAQVAAALQVALGATEAQRLSEKPTSNLAAYDAYLQGQALFDRGFEATTQRQAAAQFERAVARAASLDPQAWRNHLSLALILSDLRRPRDARGALDRGLALSPTQLNLIQQKVVTYLQEGDLAGARAVAAATPAGVEPTALSAFFTFQVPGLSWTLSPPQRELLLRLSPGAFDDDRAAWAEALATEYWLRGNVAEARKFAETARKRLREQLAEAPGDAFRQAYLGRVLALLGEREAAVAEAARAIAGWLRVDPNFDPLRGSPRFEKLARGEC